MKVRGEPWVGPGGGVGRDLEVWDVGRDIGRPGGTWDGEGTGGGEGRAMCRGM